VEMNNWLPQPEEDGSIDSNGLKEDKRSIEGDVYHVLLCRSSLTLEGVAKLNSVEESRGTN